MLKKKKNKSAVHEGIMNNQMYQEWFTKFHAGNFS